MGGPALVDGKEIEEFDNFEYTPFFYEGKEWISSEQAYQASKFEDLSYREKIRKTTQSTRIWEMGQSRVYKIVENFDRVRSMSKILLAKISSNPYYIQLLINTKGDITFPESDAFWGTNGGQGGRNHLGKIFMRMRKALKYFIKN